MEALIDNFRINGNGKKAFGAGCWGGGGGGREKERLGAPEQGR